MLEQSRVSHSPDAASGLQAKRVVDSVQSFTDLPDLLLVERTRGRDTRAFETLMRRYNRRLYRIARSILSHDDMAEEAVRAAYIRAFANLDRYEPAGKFEQMPYELRVVLAICGLFNIFFFVYPAPLVGIASAAAHSLF